MDIINGQSLRQTWDELAQLHNSKIALIHEDLAGATRQLSYSQLNTEINRTGNLFSSLGVVKGDKVAVHLNNSVEFILCWFGLAKIGAIMVPVNTNLLKDECAYITEFCKVKLVVARNEHLGIYQEIKHQQPHIEALIAVGCNHDSSVALCFDDLLTTQPTELLSTESVSADDVAEIMFTSGTTSRPKGVVITHYNLRFAGYWTGWQTSLRQDDIYLTSMPAYHIDCQCTAAMAAFSVGATFVLLEKYSARAFWRQIVKYRATVTECIPLMMRTLMMQPQQPWERNHCLREVLFYLNISEQEKTRFTDRFGVNIFTSWGMTETIVGIIGDRPGDRRRWPSIGRVGLCYQARIADAAGNTLAANQEGEIQVKGEPGKTLFLEYYNAPEKTAEAFTEDGWLKTGDVGYIDADGFFYFLDRSCNMIKRCGENVSCVEIENIMSQHPDIVEAAVVGVQDSVRDQAIKAYVVTEENVAITAAEIIEYCSLNMAKFKVPSFVEICCELPKTSTGKVKKHQLCTLH